MYRNNHPKQKQLDYVFYFDCGGLGDLIAALPVIQYTINTFKHINVYFFVPDFAFDLVKASLTGKYVLKKLSDYKPGISPLMSGKSLASMTDLQLAVHLTDVASLCFLNTILDPKYKSYLPVNTENTKLEKFNLPDRFVIITTNYTSDVREFDPEKVNLIIDYVKEKGYEVVFLGKSKSEAGTGYVVEGKVKHNIHFNKGLKLIDKTTLVESAAIMKKAKVVIGVDNGLLHLAATTETPVIAGFTTVDPVARIPYNAKNFYTVVPPESLKCRFCQSNLVMEFGNDFTKCLYQSKGLDNKIQCIQQLPVLDFINYLEKIL